MLPFGPRRAVFDVVIDPVAVDPPHPVAFGLVDRIAVDRKTDRLAHELVVEGALGVLKTRKFEPEIGRDDWRQRQVRVALDPVDQFSGDIVNNVGFAAFEHSDSRRCLRHADHRELLDVHRAVVALERLEVEPYTRLLGDELVGTSANRLLRELGLSGLLVVFRRDNPARATDIGRAEQDQKIEKRFREVKTNGTVVDDFDSLRSFVQHIPPGAPVVLVAPFDVVRGNR